MKKISGKFQIKFNDENSLNISLDGKFTTEQGRISVL